MFTRSARLATVWTMAIAAIASICDAQAFDRECTAPTPPYLQTHGSQLLVDGQPRFLVLVSYFDVMRATPAAIESDFAFLKSKGVDGVRVFPTWIHEAGLPSAQKPDATLLDSDGRIRSQERWDHFRAALLKAAACGFIVDVTFTRDMLNTVSPFPVAKYRGDPILTRCGGGTGDRAHGLAEIACRLKGPTYPHVFIDMQNERNAGNPGMHLTMAEVRGIRDAIKAVDATRLVMVSHGGGNTADTLAVAREARPDVLAFHDEQREGWFTHTAAHIQALKSVGRPIYVQEGARATLPGERFRGARCANTTPEDNPLLKGLVAAKQAGAAAWTFHTDAGFRLDTESFQRELSACSREMEFLNGVAGAR